MNNATLNSGHASRRWQFSLQTLFLLMLVLCIWMGYRATTAQRQRSAVMALMQQEVQIIYDFEQEALPAEKIVYDGFFGTAQERSSLQPAGPRWLRRIIGDDYFQKATAAWLDCSHVDRALPHLKQLPYLKEVYFPAASCAQSLPSNHSAMEKLKEELPRVRITIIPPPPIVG